MNPAPQDPKVRQLIAMMQNKQMSRRSFLRGGLFAGAVAGAAGLTACSSAPKVEQGDGSAGQIIWGNWTYYLDFDEETQTFPTLDRFMAETNIKVDYIEDIDDNNTFYGKIKDQLSLDQNTGYDVMTMSDWMNGRLINANQLQKLDRSRMPNTESLIESLQGSLPTDPNREYTMPWQAPLTGLVWSKEVVPDGIKTLDDLMKPELKGKVGMLSEMRDTMGLIMLGQGVDVDSDSWGDKEFDAALAWLDDAVKSGQIGNIKGNSYTQDLETDNMLAGFAWSGDVAVLNSENDDRWGFEIPEFGGIIAADSFTIPNGTSAENKELVEEMIDYYYQPEVAAEVAAYVWYVTPVEGAREAMENVDPELVDNEYIFPSDETQSRLKGFRTLTDEEDQRYSKLYNEVLGL